MLIALGWLQNEGHLDTNLAPSVWSMMDRAYVCPLAVYSVNFGTLEYGPFSCKIPLGQSIAIKTASQLKVAKSGSHSAPYG